MAEMAVSFAREKLLPLVIDEANLLWGIPKEFADIKEELEYIQAFLKDADERAAAESNEGVKTWVKQLREASFRIEDVIDEYMILVEQQPDALGCAALLFECDITHFIESLKRRHQIASEIQQIKSSVQRIKQRGIEHHFLIQPSVEKRQSSYRSSESVQWDDPRMLSRDLDEAEVVGIEGPRDELISRLVNGPEERSVISVLGMGGLGKTTLVSKVFNNQKVIGHFDCHAWITVSQSYTVERLMTDLLKELCKEKGKKPQISDMNPDSLIDEVKSYLQQKRYVVIFDDVWSLQLWGQIKKAMLDNNNGSRILITTRSKYVVNSCKKSPSDQVYELKPLTFEKSVELFCKKTFRCHNNGRCPEDLVNISFNFVKICKGLPLAIVAIGGLLSDKEKTTCEWENIRQSLSLEMEKNPHLIGIKKILGFSYDDLPYYLKSCLLYFGIYPEDYEVRSKRLISQWIAEGFVKHEGKTLEYVAQQYLTELIDRSLVQVSSFTIDGKVKSCRIHDLLREMILGKFKDSSFCQRISKENESMSSGVSNGMIRRLSIATISDDLMGSTESSHTRSLLVFADEESTLTSNFVRTIPTKYRLLKVLDFQDSPLSFVPENWGNLAHLKYLNLRKSVMPAQLPKFIGELQNLETLDIRRTKVKEMPKEICKLRKLRHLLVDNMTLFQLKNGLGGMTSLQTLYLVKLTVDNGVELIREMEKLKQLRTLGLIGVKKKHASVLCASINEMQNLEKLRIQTSGSRDEVIDLHAISSLPRLRKLNLHGELNKLPEWISQLKNLVKLSLIKSQLTDDPLKSLQALPHLLFLDISFDAYEGESLYFQDGGFQQLKELYIKHLRRLNSIMIEKGALHSLKKLQIFRIPLWTVPPGIQHLEKLELLDIYDMSWGFNECVAPNEGPEHPVIQHVPLVRITSQGSTTVFRH